jgi:hypothetical protein
MTEYDVNFTTALPGFITNPTLPTGNPDFAYTMESFPHLKGLSHKKCVTEKYNRLVIAEAKWFQILS